MLEHVLKRTPVLILIPSLAPTPIRRRSAGVVLKLILMLKPILLLLLLLTPTPIRRRSAGVVVKVGSLT